MIDTVNNNPDVYGEDPDSKVILKPGINIPCRWEMTDAPDTNERHGQVLERTSMQVWVSTRYLHTRRIEIKVGSYFRCSDIWFEITDIINKPYNPMGQPWLNNSISCECISVSEQEFDMKQDIEFARHD